MGEMIPYGTLGGLLVPLVAGAVVGAMGYRYWLKRDPAALEAWAKRLKELGSKKAAVDE